jgi:hypothetical protein
MVSIDTLQRVRVLLEHAVDLLKLEERLLEACFALVGV